MAVAAVSLWRDVSTDVLVPYRPTKMKPPMVHGPKTGFEVNDRFRALSNTVEPWRSPAPRPRLRHKLNTSSIGLPGAHLLPGVERAAGSWTVHTSDR